MHTNSSIVWAMAANASGFYVTATFAVRMGARFPSRVFDLLEYDSKYLACLFDV